MGSSTGKPLQALRIPQGWEVLYNQFFDVEPKFKTHDDVSWDFGEDMIMLQNPDAGVIVDLGWYPSHQSSGRFGLVVVQIYDDGEKMAGSWFEPLREFRTRSKRKVVKTLEQWLDWYSNHEPAADRRARLRPGRRTPS